MFVTPEYLLRISRTSPNMTIGIGMISKDAIILASDLRTEEEDGGKTFSLPKITLFSVGSLHVGIVQAGKTDFSTRAVQRCRELADGKSPATAAEFMALASAACKEVRIHAGSLHTESALAIIESQFDLLIAVWDTDGPRIYKINSASCFEKIQQTGVAYIGTGKHLADYILDGISPKDRWSTEILAAAIHAVSVITKKEASCEGPVDVGMVFPKSTLKLAEPLVKSYAKACQEFEQTCNKPWFDLLTSQVIENYLRASARPWVGPFEL